MDERAYWLGFNLIKGIGAVRLRALLDFFGDLQTAWNAPLEALTAAGLSERLATSALAARKEVDLEARWNELERKQITLLTWNDPGYPRRLKEIDQPPPVLYLRGDLLIEDDWAVAIVGTRRVTSYGRQVTEEVAAYLARSGIAVVSGMARGVDGVAHDTALRAGGRTLAVLGCGVDVTYPPEHLRLSERIIAQGALISDYAPGTQPESANFPPRNRIIAGLSLATVVIEAGETSGALITASFAADQGREVLALPGNIYAPQSKGTNKLIQTGARPLLRVEDVMDALSLDRVQEQRQARQILPADDLEARLLDILSAEPQHIDEIGAQIDLSIEQVSATLTLMELKGMIRHVGGMNYVTTRETREAYRA